MIIGMPEEHDGMALCRKPETCTGFDERQGTAMQYRHRQ